MNDVIKSYEHFANVNDFANALEIRPYSKSGETYCRSKYSLETVTRYLRHGDAETADKIKTMQKSLKMKGNGEKKAVEMCKSFCGFMPNVGALMAGDPNCMYNVKNNIRRESKVVKLALYFSHYSGAKEEVEFKSKCIFLSAVARLELQGYSFNIDFIGGAKSFSKNENISVFSINIKRALQRLNLNNVSYLLCNISSYRAENIYLAKSPKYRYSSKGTGFVISKYRIVDIYPNKGAKIITLEDIYGKTQEEIINILTK